VSASWGHSIRAATATERVSGTDTTGGWIRRGCGRRCAEPVAFRLSYYLTVQSTSRAAAEHPRLVVRYACPVHAARFAKLYHLVVPSPWLPVDQALLPFTANTGASDGR